MLLYSNVVFSHRRSLWRGLYFRFESGVHPRETWQDFLQTTHDHSCSLEDHVKLLVKRIDSLRKVMEVKKPRKKHAQDICKYDHSFNNDDHVPDKIMEEKASVEPTARNLMIAELESELKTVALEWKSSRQIDECICSTTFDVFSKKVNFEKFNCLVYFYKYCLTFSNMAEKKYFNRYSWNEHEKKTCLTFPEKEIP